MSAAPVSIRAVAFVDVVSGRIARSPRATRPNAVMALNRAIAVAALDGVSAGLAALASIDEVALEAYQPYHAARADLLMRVGDHDGAIAAYDRALALTSNRAERRFLAAQRDIAADRRSSAVLLSQPEVVVDLVSRVADEST